MTGPIIIDDVIYESVDDDVNCLFPSKELIFRRLTFQRSKNLVQSEALLTSEKEHKNTRSSSKSKKRGNQRGNSSNISVINGVTLSVLFYYRVTHCLCPFFRKVPFMLLFVSFVIGLVGGGNFLEGCNLLMKLFEFFC